MNNKPTKHDFVAVNLNLRRTIIIFLSLALVILTGFAVFFSVNDVKSLKYFLYVGVMQHIAWLFGFIYFKNLSIDTVITMYLSLISVIFYPIACVFWNAGDPVVFFWYMLIIIGAIVFDKRNMGVWISAILIIVISVFFAHSLFPQENFAPGFMYQTNVLTVIATIILAAFFVIVLMKHESLLSETSRTPTEDAENRERDKSLYDALINYMEESKPFKNPDFNAQTLAKSLNSNILYISKAISFGGCGDFHNLLNTFRINYAKSMLDNGATKKYTIDYIYTEAGYKHRSTFNTAFKNITGLTPSEYIAQNANNDS